MALDKFWLQSNNGKQIDLQNLKELKKSDLGNNNALIQLFNIFDTQKADGTAGSDGVLNKSELTSLFNTFNAGANSSKGMSKSVFESNEAEEYLNTTKTTSGKTLSEIGVKATDLFEFLSKFAQNSNAPVNVNNVANDLHLTEEQAQDEVISIISEDTANARTLLMKQDNGHISQLYNKAKELFDSDLSLSNVEEAFMLQEECLENLSKAKEGKLSKREYFLQNREHLKAMMKRRLFRKDENTGLDFLDNNRGKMSKQEFAKFMEDYINEEINRIDRLDNLNKFQHSLLATGVSGINNMLKKYQKAAQNKQKAAQNKQTINFKPEVESAKLPSKTSAIPEKYNTTESMTFKEVFEIERNQEYSKDRVEAYISQKQKTDFAVGAYNKYQSFKMNSSEILNDYTKSVAGTYTFGGGMAVGVQPNPEKQMQKVLEAFESYYANPIDPNSAKNEIETLIKDNKLPVTVIQISDGKLSLDLSNLKTNAEKNNVLNKLLKLEDTKLEAKLKTTLGGEVDEMLEMLSTNTQFAFTNAYGHDFTNELVQEMSEDNKTVIQRYTGNASQIGMGLTVVGGVLCFTPLAGVGATMVGVGNAMAIGGMVAESALGFEEALSRSNLNPEEIKELSKTLVMNAGGFVVGYKAGQTGMKAFNKLIDKKLAEVFKTEMSNGNRAEALKQVFSNPEYLKNFMQAAGVKLSADFMISYAGDLAMMGILDTNDDWKSLLQSNLIGIMTSMGGDLKDVANLGIKGNKATTIQSEGAINNKVQELSDLRNDTELKKVEGNKKSFGLNDKSDVNADKEIKIVDAIDISKISDEPTSHLKSIQTKEDLIAFIKGKNIELAQKLENISDDDWKIIQNLIDEFKDSYEDSFVQVFKTLVDYSEKNNSSISVGLQFVDRILKVPHGVNGSDFIDAFVPPMALFVNNANFDIIKALLDLRDTCDNPLLNIDNIFYVSTAFSRVTDIEKLVNVFKEKKQDGTYKYANNDFYYMTIYDIQPELKDVDLEKNKKTLLDSYKDSPIYNRLETFLQKASIDEVNQLLQIHDFPISSKQTQRLSEIEQLMIKYINQNDLDFIQQDIRYSLEQVEDSELKEQINNSIDEIINSSFFTKKGKLVKLKELQKVVDAYNNMNSNYTTIRKSDNGSVHNNIKFFKYLEKNNPELLKVLNPNEKSESRFKNFVLNYIEKVIGDITRSDIENHMKDFILEQKYDVLVEYCKEYDNEYSTKFYKEYLDSLDVPANIKQKCSDISNDFGVKIFLPKNLDNAETNLNFIYDEFAEWNKRSGGNFKRPPVIDIMQAKSDYIDKTSAYGKNKSAGYSECHTSGAISLDGFNNVEYALRHELTHTNDFKRSNEFPEDFLVYDLVLTDTTAEVKTPVLNVRESKFYEDFVKIGIPLEHISYAYNNPMEFIAVAAEGDLSKASPEFKKQLIDFGMPEYLFEMEPPQSKKEIADEIQMWLNKNPDSDVEDFYRPKFNPNETLEINPNKLTIVSTNNSLNIMHDGICVANTSIYVNTDILGRKTMMYTKPHFVKCDYDIESRFMDELKKVSIKLGAKGRIKVV